MGLRDSWKRFREDFDAAGAAVDRRLAREAGDTTAHRQLSKDEEAVIIANGVTAGNVANSQ